MSTFTFTSMHFIESRDGIMRQLESERFKEASCVDLHEIPRDREYIVIVPKRTKISRNLLRNSLVNVIFILDDCGYSCASDKNVKATQSRKCFYIRMDSAGGFTDSRLPGLRLMHGFYKDSKFFHDMLTLDEYFKRAISTPCSPDKPATCNALFESAFKKGYELRQNTIKSYLKNAIKSIPNMINDDQRELVFPGKPGIIDELNARSPKNVKWFSRDDHIVLSIDY